MHDELNNFVSVYVSIHVAIVVGEYKRFEHNSIPFQFVHIHMFC